MNEFIYILSISMQISGALIITLFTLSTKREKIINKFINKDLINQDGNTKELEYDEKEFVNTFKNAYLNKFSFCYIALGYILGIFGEVKKIDKYVIALFIIITTIIIIVITYVIVSIIAKQSKKINKKITPEELKKMNLEPNLSTISKEEIDKLFND